MSPVSESFVVPPVTVSTPAPPVRVSLPDPPSMCRSRLPPSSVSLPPLPLITCSTPVTPEPSYTSSPAPPVKVTVLGVTPASDKSPVSVTVEPFGSAVMAMFSTPLTVSTPLPLRST